MLKNLCLCGGVVMVMMLNTLGCEEQSTQASEVRQSRVLKIAMMGHPILSAKAKVVANPQDPEVRRIVEDMVATAEDIGSYAGLAAPQVYIPLRILLFCVPKERGTPVPLTVMINPVWEPITDEIEEDWEACFSVPNFMGKVPRYKKIRYSYKTLEGNSVNCEAEGFHARVVQHECDHLDGKFYIEHIKDFSHFGCREEIIRYHKEKTL